MSWTERQQAMLQAMGLKVWAPAGMTATATAAAAPAVPAAAAAPAAAAVAAAPAAPAARAPAPTRRASAARADLATLDWPALRDAVAGCRACSLCGSRTQTVFGVGHQQAHWMVVGEAPGENEDLQGEPFVGAAGQLLDRMLAALQLARAADGPPARSVYIANTLKCRPPRNRNPGAEELAQCEPFLVRQVELLQPRIILAMGRFAVQALLRSDEAIGRLRGRVHRYQGVPLVVTYHPAYLLRSPLDKAKAWEDLCLAAATLEGGPA
ncbi:MAG: uracil-DNA glycosylase [Leptothrix sp. (in: Bacteria)]|nr:uracil-DNA glycosylase [Leptothrix sp. (in: b-proteobacteria)]